MSRWRLGLRSEITLLIPVALLLFVLVSTFTLFAYRNALALLTEERQGEAARTAQALAERVERGAEPRAELLLPSAPTALGVAILDAQSRPLSVAGEIETAGLVPPEAELASDRRAGLGPGGGVPDRVAGFAVVRQGAERRLVRVDLAAGTLARQHAAVRILTVDVLAVDAGLMVLVVLFTRRALAPYEALLARARQAGGLADDGGDEVAELVATFERAVTALALAQPEGDEIQVLERTLTASLQSGLLLLDAEGRVLAVNPVGAALLGITLPVPGSVSLSQLLGGQPELLRLLVAAVEQGTEIRRAECAIASPSGALTLGLTAHPLRREGGAVRGLLVLFADLTEARQRAWEDRVAESLAHLAELAAGIAHELRNSLATVRGYLSLVERSRDAGALAGYLQEIRGEADHLERVLDDFLSFARPGSVRMEPFPLARVLSRVAADPALSGTTVELAAGESPWISGDGQLIERAVRNLVRNAAEARPGGSVEIDLRHTEEGWEISVEDRGAGIPPEIRDRLFHPFVTARPGGVGLGLSLAHRIVVLHQGRLRLEDREGGGTRAVITLPGDLEVPSPEAARPSKSEGG